MINDIVDSKNLTCYQLSKKSGISYTAINELYRGERTLNECSFLTAKKLASALNMSLDELSNKAEERMVLPEKLYHCFWDCNPSKLDLIKNKTYIICRLLDMGGYDGLVFIRKAYTYEEIKDVAMHSRNFSPKVASFLRNIYHLKSENMVFYQRNIQDWR